MNVELAQLVGRDNDTAYNLERTLSLGSVVLFGIAFEAMEGAKYSIFVKVPEKEAAALLERATA